MAIRPVLSERAEFNDSFFAQPIACLRFVDSPQILVIFSG
jgi:hypothetical protein